MRSPLLLSKLEVGEKAFHVGAPSERCIPHYPLFFPASELPHLHRDDGAGSINLLDALHNWQCDHLGSFLTEGQVIPKEHPRFSSFVFSLKHNMRDRPHAIFWAE